MMKRLAVPLPSVAARRSLLALGGLLALVAALHPLLPEAARPTLPSPGLSEEAGSKATEAVPAGERAQHLARLGAARWHAAGHRGRGVKVAVLDSGFRGYRDHLGKSLPSEVTVRSFRKDGNLEARDSQHGILCGEVVHALAPAAELLFANWEPDHPDAFLQAVRWAREQGAQVISCSVIMPSYSDGEGGGPVHAALARLLGNGDGRGDALCFASAGNTAERHWAGRFRLGSDGFHQWADGEPDNVLTPWGDEEVSVELCWRQGVDYRVYVHDRQTEAEVGGSPARAQPSGGGVVVRFRPEPGHTYRVRVQLRSGEPGPFHLVALHSGLSRATAAGSVAFPADGPEVIAVGAVDHKDRRMAYSACGPVSSQPKPDLVAPVPFASQWRSRPFAGTSAAAPQAAALAALLWSRQPDWTAKRVRAALSETARDLGPPGHDWETGHGLVGLP